MNNSDKNKKIILDRALNELERVLKDLKAGKVPALPKSLKTLSDIVNAAEKKVKENKVKEEELDPIFDKIAEDIKKDKK